LAAKPLPPLHVARDASAGVRVPFDVELTWDEASRLLTESFGGKSYDNVHLDSLRLAPGADGKVRVEAQIDYRGGGLKKYHGLVLLDGTPRFDVATNALALDAVDYALDPHRHNPFLRIGDRVAHDALRQRLAQTARWSLAAQIADVRRAIETATTRPLARAAGALACALAMASGLATGAVRGRPPGQGHRPGRARRFRRLRYRG